MPLPFSFFDESNDMPKMYFVFKNKEGVPAVGIHAPKDSEVLGMAGTLDGAKDIQRSMLEQMRKAPGKVSNR